MRSLPADSLQKALRSWDLLGASGTLSLEQIIERVERRISRRILVLPVVLPLEPSGMYVRVQGYDVDVILVASDANFIHHQHICLHEIGHVILDHPLRFISSSQIKQLSHCPIPSDNVELLLRCCSEDNKNEEDAAEELATYFLGRSFLYTPLPASRMFSPDSPEWGHEDVAKLEDALRNLELV